MSAFPRSGLSLGIRAAQDVTCCFSKSVPGTSPPSFPSPVYTAFSSLPFLSRLCHTCPALCSEFALRSFCHAV